MSRYFVKNIEHDRYETISWGKHPQAQFYKVQLDGMMQGQVYKDTMGGWGAIPWKYKRGGAMGCFRTRYDATIYMLWASGLIPEDQKPGG